MENELKVFKELGEDGGDALESYFFKIHNAVKYEDYNEFFSIFERIAYIVYYNNNKEKISRFMKVLEKIANYKGHYSSSVNVLHLAFSKFLEGVYSRGDTK